LPGSAPGEPMLLVALALLVPVVEALPEGNALVQGLAQKQRDRERALNDYTYDILETTEKLDGHDAVKERQIRLFEVFYVRGLPVRRLVGENDRALSPKEQAKEDQKVQARVNAIKKGPVDDEARELKLSSILERYDFHTVARDEVAGRPTLVLDFVARPGKRKLERDNVLRALAGRLWVDEAEREVVRAQIHNTGGIKFALGLGASVAALGVDMAFQKVENAVWLPSRIEGHVAGRVLLVKGFRARTSAVYSHYRHFQVESEEQIHPPPPPRQ